MRLDALRQGTRRPCVKECEANSTVNEMSTAHTSVHAGIPAPAAVKIPQKGGNRRPVP